MTDFKAKFLILNDYGQPLVDGVVGFSLNQTVEEFRNNDEAIQITLDNLNEAFRQQFPDMGMSIIIFPDLIE